MANADLPLRLPSGETMLRTRLAPLLVWILGVCSACGPAAAPSPPSSPSPSTTPTATPPVACADRVFAAMTPDQRIGQLFELGLAGDRLGPTEITMIQTDHIGSVVRGGTALRRVHHQRALFHRRQPGGRRDPGHAGRWLLVDSGGGRTGHVGPDGAAEPGRHLGPGASRGRHQPELRPGDGCGPARNRFAEPADRRAAARVWP